MTSLDALKSRYSVSVNPVLAERRVELAAIAVGALLCLQILWGISSYVLYEGPETIQPAPDSLTVKSASAEVTVDASAQSQLVSRPLFWESHRPAEQVALEAAAAEEETDTEPGKLKGVKLLGVFGSKDAGGAILLVKGEKRRVPVGGSIDGWALESITARSATFVSSQGRDEKWLADGGDKIQVSAPSGGAAQGGGTGTVVNSKPSSGQEKDATGPEGGELSLGGRG